MAKKQQAAARANLLRQADKMTSTNAKSLATGSSRGHSDPVTIPVPSPDRPRNMATASQAARATRDAVATKEVFQDYVAA